MNLQAEQQWHGQGSHPHFEWYQSILSSVLFLFQMMSASVTVDSLFDKQWWKQRDWLYCSHTSWKDSLNWHELIKFSDLSNGRKSQDIGQQFNRIIEAKIRSQVFIDFMVGLLTVVTYHLNGGLQSLIKKIAVVELVASNCCSWAG